MTLELSEEVAETIAQYDEDAVEHYESLMPGDVVEFRDRDFGSDDTVVSPKAEGKDLDPATKGYGRQELHDMYDDVGLVGAVEQVFEETEQMRQDAISYVMGIAYAEQLEDALDAEVEL